MTDPLLESFFQSCEVSEPPRLRINGQVILRALSHPFSVLGCHPGCDLSLQDPSLSPRHCFLQAIGPRILCVDLGSEQGIATSEGHVLACWIDRHQAVKVGNQILSLDLGESGLFGNEQLQAIGREALDHDSLFTRPLPHVVLEFQVGTIKTRWSMNRAVAIVGSGTDCTVRLRGSQVSSYHCAFILTGQGLWMVDLLGHLESPKKAGVYVNGSPLRFARIDSDDQLMIGPFRINVQYLADPPRILRPYESMKPIEEGRTSREIELTTHDRVTFPRPPIRSKSVDDLESLRLLFETRFVRQAEAHRAEIEGLRGEIDDLRDLLETIRSPATTRRLSHHPRARTKSPAPIRPSSSKSGGRQERRTLGAATRRPRLSASIPATRQPAQLPDQTIADPISMLLPNPGEASSALESWIQLESLQDSGKV